MCVLSRILFCSFLISACYSPQRWISTEVISTNCTATRPSRDSSRAPFGLFNKHVTVQHILILDPTYADILSADMIR
ncbi:hypothetical protein F4775DRAFT_535329 [Biscogniauxia sp. FL1348]|nr:hypothetical protein F4775DRAFT_535329 [Biscogniauxia sp. FL1348]